MVNAVFSIYFDSAGVDGTPGLTTAIDALGPPNLLFKNADNPLIDSLNKITIPAAGTVYSFLKHIYIKCTANADAHTMNNVTLWSDGTNSLGLGIDMMIGLEFPTHTAALTTGYEVADATEMVAQHGSIATSTSIFTKTSAVPLTVTITEAGAVINAVGETCNYIIMQANIASTANPGISPTETTTISYDEA